MRKAIRGLVVAGAAVVAVSANVAPATAVTSAATVRSAATAKPAPFRPGALVFSPSVPSSGSLKDVSGVSAKSATGP